MRGRAPDPGRSVKAIKRDKQRHYAGLEYYGKTVSYWANYYSDSTIGEKRFDEQLLHVLRTSKIQ